MTIAGCGKSDADAPARTPDTIRFQEIGSGATPAHGSGERPQGRILCAHAELNELFAAWRLDTNTAQAVDFTQSCVIAVRADSRPSSGFRLRVVRLAEREGRLRATVTVRRPPGIVDAMALSRPYAFVTVPRSAAVAAADSVTVDVRGER